MRKLFWFSGVLLLIPVLWAQGQTLGHPMMLNSIHLGSPSVHIVQPTLHTNAPLVVPVPRLNAPLNSNAFASRSLYDSYVNRSTLDAAVPNFQRTVPMVQPTNRLPLGTTVETADRAAVNGYSVHEIRQVQRALRRLGYYSGSVDGSFGPITQNAVENYQMRAGEPVTGTLTLGTLSRLGVMSAR